LKKGRLQIFFAIAGVGLLYLGYQSFLAKGISGTPPKKVESKIHLPDPQKVETDQETGLQVEKDVILVTFSRFADEGTINGIIKETGGEIVGFEQDSNFFQVRLPEADLAKTKKTCTELLSKHKEVEYAIPNTISKADNPYWQDGTAK